MGRPETALEKSPGGQIMHPMITPQQIQHLIEQGVPGARAEVSGDGHHFEAVIVAPAFAGKSTVEQHQMVYRALGERMKQEIHALSMRTLTPDQAA